MRRLIERLGLTADLLVTLVFGAMLAAGIAVGSLALYASPEPPQFVAPQVFADPASYAGRAGTYIEGVVRRTIAQDVMEVVPIEGGMRQWDPPLLVVLGPGARQARLRTEAQEVFFWGTVITRPEDVPPGVELPPPARRLLDEGQLFYYAERM